MLQAMNTGHEGSLSTCHANSPADALARIETMVLTGDVAIPSAVVREQLVASVDLLVQVSRVAGGARRVTAVAEVDPQLGDGGRPSVRPLAGRHGLLALPRRAARADGVGTPDQGWVVA